MRNKLFKMGLPIIAVAIVAAILSSTVFSNPVNVYAKSETISIGNTQTAQQDDRTNIYDADGNLATIPGVDTNSTKMVDNKNGTFTYTEKWIASYETLLFNTPDGDLDTGDYAPDGTGTGYYIQQLPTTQAQFQWVALADTQSTFISGLTIPPKYDLTKMTPVSIIAGHGYYDEFLTAQGAIGDWTVGSQYYGADFSTLPAGDVVRRQSSTVAYNTLKTVANAPQPVRTEKLTSSAVPQEPIDLPNGDGIGFDATSNSGSLTAVSSYSWSHTCTGSNMVLVVGDDHINVFDRTVTGVTYDGVGMTYIRSDVYYTAPYYFRSTIYFMYAPTTGGAETITVTYSGTTSLYDGGGAVSYTGVKQSGQPDNNNGSNGASGNPTVSLTTTADNCWVFATADVKTTSVASTNTSRWSFVSGTYYWGLGSDTNAPITPAGAVTMSWTGTTSAWAISAVSFAPAPTPSITVSPTTLNFGTVMPNTTYYAYNQSSSGSYPNPVTATQCYFTITNTGSSSCNIALSCTNATGGNTWTLVSGSPAGDQFEVVAVYNGENPASGLVLTNANQAFYTGLAASGTLQWDFEELLGGTGTGKAGTFSDSTVKTYTITITGS